MQLVVASGDLFGCVQNTEGWELEKTLADMEQYFWDINESRTKMISLIKARKAVDKFFSLQCCVYSPVSK